MAKKMMNTNTYRYERKFIIPSLSEQMVEILVKLNPAMFSEIFHRRYVNNIYFDSIDLVNFFDTGFHTVKGEPQRLDFLKKYII